jgi:hypothetical protein
MCFFSNRKKLQHLLQTSNLFRVQLILNKVKQTELYVECAILYAKVNMRLFCYIAYVFPSILA